jgi:hypothetical protein
VGDKSDGARGSYRGASCRAPTSLGRLPRSSSSIHSGMKASNLAAIWHVGDASEESWGGVLMSVAGDGAVPVQYGVRLVGAWDLWASLAGQPI